MTEPELLFCEDGTILSWVAQDGSLFVGVSDENESHEHRLVLAPEDVALMLLAALRSKSVYRMADVALLGPLLHFIETADMEAGAR